ncbi:LOW QUALITY PROTEIN: hypothetical protein PHMEG_00014090 [Phytophthora megakarya]|uniref:Uncharacterized protein n=1 Tax=Phytophthora megakarya TaxID=4795 RepID=A0A225W4U2_9STRA|nr:LOW QUALITY PROTEIN: hypothetical protein PHMEG_00014090 [Phytophthora megakarya]
MEFIIADSRKRIAIIFVVSFAYSTDNSFCFMLLICEQCRIREPCLEPYECDLEEVQQLMRKLRTLKQAAKLRSVIFFYKTLRNNCIFALPKFNPIGCCPQTGHALGVNLFDTKRYFRLREYISSDDDELADFLPSRDDHRKLVKPLESLRDVESVAKHLQGQYVTLVDARILFDAQIKPHPSFRRCESQNCAVPDFEQAVVKVLDNQDARPLRWTLSGEGRPAPSASDQSTTAKEGFAARKLKRRKVCTACEVRFGGQLRASLEDFSAHVLGYDTNAIVFRP